MEQIKYLFIIVNLLIFPLNNLFAQADDDEKNTTPEGITLLNGERKLVADKANVKLETAAIDSIRMLLELEEEEDEISPAEELYEGIWNNKFVKDYSNVVIPDSFQIDLSSFVMPFEGKVTSPFGPRRRRFHYGTDVKLQKGDTVAAAFEGKVRVKQYEKRGYGYYLVLRHPNGLETVYGHLSKFLVDEDETVVAGQPIALGGNTGRSTGSHLHFECRFLGQAIDPADIVDFNNFCTFDEVYNFQKSKINGISKNNKNYVAGSETIKYHRIRQGDTLGKIASKYRVSIKTLCRLNGIKQTTVLRVGRVIRYT
jgi:murein DD-endopeptidase MepM/ murein hydrolase activator NlpD